MAAPGSGYGQVHNVGCHSCQEAWRKGYARCEPHAQMVAWYWSTSFGERTRVRLERLDTEDAQRPPRHL